MKMTSLKQVWRMEHDRAQRLRAMCDRELTNHVIQRRHIIDEGSAVFMIGNPGTGIYRAEIALLSYGTVLVHGDVDTTIFSCCSYRTWEGKLGWLRGDNYGYAEEKASIGSGCSAMARDVDEELAIASVLWWRRQKSLNAETAREAISLIRDGDATSAQRAIWDGTGDFELTIGECTSPRVILAQACITKLCDLLDAEEAAKAKESAA